MYQCMINLTAFSVIKALIDKTRLLAKNNMWFNQCLYSNLNQSMGQSIPKEQPIQQLTPEIIDANIDLLFNQHNACEKLQSINQPIIIITRDLALKGSFQKTTEGFRVNHTLLKCMYHPHFQITIKNLINLFCKQLKSILETKVIAMISRQKFRKCLNIANFCIFFTDQSLIQSINLLSIRSDLEPESKQRVLQYTKEFPEINQTLFDTFGQEKLLQICRIMRLAITLMIDLHLKLLTRSDFTLKIIDKLNQSLFVMYVKGLLQNQDKEVSRRQMTQNPKVLLRIGAYFIGLGLETKCAAIYELGVCLLERLLSLKGTQLSGQKALPSHLFKSLPVVNNNQMIYWLANNLLFALKYIKNANNYFSRMNFNRIPSFKLLTQIFEKYKPHSSQITYLFEQICLQTKNFQIQRVYVCAMADIYSKLQDATDIIKKYSQIGQINFNLKAKAKQIKIKPEDVRTQLESDDQSSRKEVVALCGKYTIQVIFQKSQVYFEYSDKSLWNMILTHMQEEGTINQQPEPLELNKQGEQQKI